MKLFDENDNNVREFNRDEVISILQENEYHSIEQSNTEDEYRTRQPDEKRFLHIYNHPWRSEMVSILYLYIYDFL